MGQFDQTARTLSKPDGSTFFRWALSCAAPGLRLSFLQWDDTRRLVTPGEPDRTNDLVAQMHDESRPKRAVWLIGEIELEPARGILFRMAQYEINLGQEVNPECDPEGPLIGSLLIHLTGQLRNRRLDWRWSGQELGTHLAPFIVDLVDQDAAQTLARVKAKELAAPILPYIVLMRGGCDPKLIKDWPLVAEEIEEDIERRVQYRDAALVFAELTGCQVDWLRVLGGWQMRESQYIKQWENRGIEQGDLRRARADLLKLVRRLEDPVPETIRRAIEGTNDVQTLERWFDVALDSNTIANFRKAMNLPD